MKKALELQPEQPHVLNYLGYSWIDQGINLDEAMKMIRRAVEQRPDDGYIVDSLGWAYYRIADYESAVKQLERAIDLKPEDPTINDHLGDAYWRVGGTLEAKFQWAHARDLKPEPEELPKIEAKLRDGLPEDTSSAAAPRRRRKTARAADALPWSNLHSISYVMAGLVPAIYVLIDRNGVDAWDKPGHADEGFISNAFDRNRPRESQSHPARARRRADGYHDIESLVVFADCADTLTLTPGPELSLSTGGPGAQDCGEMSDNLVVRAARLLGGRIPGLCLGISRWTSICRLRPASAAVRRMQQPRCACWRAQTSRRG